MTNLKSKSKILIFATGLGLAAIGILFKTALSPTALVARVIDGDTIKLSNDKVVRYIGIDAPEPAKGQTPIFINQYLLEQGAGKFQLDTVNIQHSPVLAAAAQKAHQKKAGLWSKCAPVPELGYQVKGNLDRLDKRWYHLPLSPNRGEPDFRHYEQTVVNLEHGDQWFCSEKEAQEAGFERARE